MCISKRALLLLNCVCIDGIASMWKKSQEMSGWDYGGVKTKRVYLYRDSRGRRTGRPALLLVLVGKQGILGWLLGEFEEGRTRVTWHLLSSEWGHV